MRRSDSPEDQTTPKTNWANTTDSKCRDVSTFLVCDHVTCMVCVSAVSCSTVPCCLVCLTHAFSRMNSKKMSWSWHSPTTYFEKKFFCWLSWLRKIIFYGHVFLPFTCTCSTGLALAQVSSLRVISFFVHDVSEEWLTSDAKTTTNKTRLKVIYWAKKIAHYCLNLAFKHNTKTEGREHLCTERIVMF